MFVCVKLGTKFESDFVYSSISTYVKLIREDIGYVFFVRNLEGGGFQGAVLEL